MASLLPPNTTRLERRIEAADALIERADAPLGTVWNAQTQPAHMLPWLAWAVGVDDWDSQWEEQQKRDAIDEAIPIRRKRGTVWAVKRALEVLGYSDVELLEHTGQREKWIAAGGLLLDGSWLLDSRSMLVENAPRVVTTHWAQYALAFNINDAPFTARSQRRLRRRVEAAAPVRSELIALIYRYAAEFDARIWLSTPQMRIRQNYTGCRGEQVHRARLLSGCWSLSGDYMPRLLNKAKRLDGSWQLTGQAPVGEPLNHGWGTVATRVKQRTVMALQSQSRNHWTLGEVEVDRLDGTWKLNEVVDGHRKLDGSWPLSVGRLTQRRRPKLNGARTLGGTQTLNSIGTTARAVMRDRRIKTEIRL
ncbi:phage tail protein I [Halomonas sp. MES3-P3E]|uniref:phage tail protein I n=1 Tax=Halomonas sp. MES3-P3E TaxID=2058321 RepID=UPI000C33E717|nr:phage tail protein I [Halomonas sp. MES3-P3E]PKG51258.1 phage tail protein I [Halomonas sp. MES3-P3E]